MRKRTKKFVWSLVLVMAMLVSLMPVNVMQVKAAGNMIIKLPKPTKGTLASNYSGESVTLDGHSFFTTYDATWYSNDSSSFTFQAGGVYKCRLKLVPPASSTFSKATVEAFIKEGRIAFDETNGIKLNKCKAYEDGTNFGIEGEYVIPPEITSTSNFRVETFLSGQSLSWIADENHKCSGYLVYIDGRGIADIPKEKATLHEGYSGYRSFNYAPQLGVGTHTVYVIPYFTVSNGERFWGTPTNTLTIQGASLSSPQPTAVKINSKYVCIHWQKQSNAAGYYVYANGALIADTTGDSVAYKKKGAAAKSYSVAAYYMSGGAKVPVNASAAVRPTANKKVSSFNPGPSYYGYNQKCYAHVNKLYYTKSGTSKGNLKIKLSVVNTWRYLGRTVKVKVTFKNHGKTIATQTFNFGKIKPWRRVSKTFTFKKCKTEQDIAFATISTKVISK